MQSNQFSVFRVLTGNVYVGALVVIVALVALGTAQSWGETTVEQNPLKARQAKACDEHFKNPANKDTPLEWTTLNGRKVIATNLMDCLAKAEAGATTNPADEQCDKDLVTKINEAQTKFNSACSKLGISNQECLKQIFICDNCNMVDDSSAPAGCDVELPQSVQDKIDKSSEEDYEFDLADLGSLAGRSNYNAGRTRQRKINYYQLATCKPFAALRLDAVVPKVSSLKRDVNESETTMNTLTGEMAELKNQLQNLASDAQEILDGVEERFKNKYSVAFDKIQQANQKLTEEIEQITAELSKARSQKISLKIQLDEELAKVAKTCEDEAERAVQAQRQSLQAKLNASRNSISNTSQFYRQVSSTTPRSMIQIRDRAEANCRLDRAKFSRPRDRVMAVYNDRVRSMEEIIKTLEGTLASRIQAMQSSSSQLSTEENKIKAEYAKAIQSAQKSIERKAKDLQLKIDNKQKEIDLAAKKLREDQDDLDYYRETETMALTAVNGGEPPEGAGKDVQETGSNLTDAVGNYISNCKCEAYNDAKNDKERAALQMSSTNVSTCGVATRIQNATQGSTQSANSSPATANPAAAAPGG